MADTNETVSMNSNASQAMNTTNQTTLSDEDLLSHAYNHLVMEYLPVTVCMAVISIVGIIGNILTIIFYAFKTKKTSTIILIIYLAVFDLSTCFLIFTTIADLSINVYFSNDIACRAMYFADHWIVVSSVLILWIISIDRFRKVCKPHGRQFTVRTASWAVLIASSASFAMSARDLFTYTPVPLEITVLIPSDSGSDGTSARTVDGHYCTYTDDDSKQILISVFLIFDILMIASILATFIYTYGKLWLVLRRHNKNTEGLRSTNPGLNLKAESSSRIQDVSTDDDTLEDTLGSNKTRYATPERAKAVDKETGESSKTSPTKSHVGNGNTSTDEVKFTLDAGSKDTEPRQSQLLQVPSARPQCVIQSDGDSTTSAKLKPVGSMASFISIISHASRKKTKKSTVRKERSVTIMMFAVSVGFFVCFSPYFVVTIFRLVTVTTIDELTAPIQFALRSPFWNGVINPIIFCVFNPQYRNYIKLLFTKCKLNKNTAGYNFGSSN